MQAIESVALEKNLFNSFLSFHLLPSDFFNFTFEFEWQYPQAHPNAHMSDNLLPRLDQQKMKKQAYSSI
jgi:hypothetical protein